MAASDCLCTMDLISLYFRPTVKVLFSIFPLFADNIDDPGSNVFTISFT